MSINLAPKETLEDSPFWKKFIYWSTTIGRIVIIGTQMIVLGAFFTRFFLDRQIIDLSEEIKTKQTIIQTMTQLETEFRTTQDQLAAITAIKKQQNNYAKTLQSFTQKIPQQVSVQRINLEKNELNIDGRADTGEGFAHFLTMLATSENIQQVALEGARITSEGALEFDINIQNTPGAYRYEISSEKS